MMQKGCACRFLYGPGTDQEKITEIDKALEAKTELQVEVQFYRKNGRNFCLRTYILFLWTIMIKIWNVKNIVIPSIIRRYLYEIIPFLLIISLYYYVLYT